MSKSNISLKIASLPHLSTHLIFWRGRFAAAAQGRLTDAHIPWKRLCVPAYGWVKLQAGGRQALGSTCREPLSLGSQPQATSTVPAELRDPYKNPSPSLLIIQGISLSHCQCALHYWKQELWFKLYLLRKTGLCHCWMWTWAPLTLMEFCIPHSSTSQVSSSASSGHFCVACPWKHYCFALVEHPRRIKKGWHWK